MASGVAEAADHYATLGLSPGAGGGEGRAACRRMERASHPDVNPRPDAAERFRAVVAAYEVLSDPATRAAYDARRRTGGGAAGGVGGGRGAPGRGGGSRGGGGTG